MFEFNFPEGALIKKLTIPSSREGLTLYVDTDSARETKQDSRLKLQVLMMPVPALQKTNVVGTFAPNHGNFHPDGFGLDNAYHMHIEWDGLLDFSDLQKFLRALETTQKNPLYRKSNQLAEGEYFFPSSSISSVLISYTNFLNQTITADTTYPVMPAALPELSHPFSAVSNCMPSPAAGTMALAAVMWKSAVSLCKWVVNPTNNSPEPFSIDQGQLNNLTKTLDNIKTTLKQKGYTLESQ